MLRLAASTRGGAEPSAAPGSIKGGGGPRNALGYRPEPEVLLPAETSREAPKCCAWQHQEGGPRNALGYRPEPEVLRLPAETSREAPKCCAWQHQGGGPETRSLASRNEPRGFASAAPETRSGTVQSLKCCPCQQKRAARLPSAAPRSIKGGGGPETRSGTVQSLKCCPCQQKRAASAAPGSIKRGAPKRARAPCAAPASRNEPRGLQVLRLAASRGGPRNALGYRPEPEVLPLPAETSREAPKCCIKRGGARNALGREDAAAASRNEPRGSQVLRLAASRGAPKRARAPSRA